MTFVDGNGVPWIVQGVQFNYHDMSVDLKLFDGQDLTVCAFQVIEEGLSLEQTSLTNLQVLQIEKHLEENWVLYRD